MNNIINLREDAPRDPNHQRLVSTEVSGNDYCYSIKSCFFFITGEEIALCLNNIHITFIETNVICDFV